MISKKSKVILILCVFAFAFVSALASYTAYAIYALKTEPITYKSQIYSVKSGFTQATVIDDFAPNLVAKYIYKIYFKFNPQFTAIQKGDYFVGGKKTLLELLHDMVQGNVVIKKYPTFTIAEGTNLMRILNSISKRSLKDDKFSLLISTPDKLMQEALKDHQDLLSFIDGPYENLEGFIAPATYPMYEKDPYFKMFKVGLIKQLQYLKQAWDKRAKNEEIKTPYQALILASLIENHHYQEKDPEVEKALDKYLEPLIKEDIDTLILGCTHYPLIKNEIKEVLGDVAFFDGGKGVANRLLDLLKNNDLLTKELTKSNISFYDSSNLENKKTRFYELLN